MAQELFKQIIFIATLYVFEVSAGTSIGFESPGCDFSAGQILYGYELNFFYGVVYIGETILAGSLNVYAPDAQLVHVKLNLTAIIFSYVLIGPVGIAMDAHIADTIIILLEFSGIVDTTKFYAFQGFTKQIMICGLPRLLLGDK